MSPPVPVAPAPAAITGTRHQRRPPDLLQPAGHVAAAFDRQFDLDLNLNVNPPPRPRSHRAPRHDTEPPATDPLPPPPVLAPLSVTATPVGPAFAGLSATVNVSTGVAPAAAGASVAGASLGRSLVVQADPAPPAGPVTVTASVPVLDWGVPGCAAGTTCVLPAAANDMTLRLDLRAVKAGDAVPVTVTITADGAAAGHGHGEPDHVGPPGRAGVLHGRPRRPGHGRQHRAHVPARPRPL